jgi:hypothetical protein
MKNQLKLLLVLFVISVMLGRASSGQQDVSTKRILFIGNSLTYYNDVPKMVGAIYSAVDGLYDLEVDLLAEGGISIEQHLSKGALKPKLTSTVYDFVVIQDFGGWPLCDTSFPACSSNTAPLSTAIDMVRKSGAKPIWFLTYQSKPIKQRELSFESHQIASQLDVDIADIGAAMLDFSTANEMTNILLPNYHPNTLGSWIAAATIVRTLVDKPLPEALMLDSVCRQIWQGSGLSADQLASAQKPKDVVCDRLAPDLLLKVVRAANNSFNIDASNEGDG